MTEWQIDSKLRRATRGDDVVSFHYDGELWQIEAPAEGKAPTGARQALTEWVNALRESVEFLTSVGEACFGRDWILPMSNALAVNRTSVHRWLTLERPLTMDHPIWPDVLQVLDRRQEDLQKQIGDIVECRKELKAVLRKTETFESGRHAGGAD